MTTILALKTLNAQLLPPVKGAWQVDLSEPARSVMTDFNERGMVTVNDSTQVDAALEMMRHAQTRSAFVVNAEETRVLGFVTAYDICGEKPMLHLQSVGCTHLTCSRDDVRVSDIMDRVENWPVLEMRDVEAANVRTILDTLSKAGRTHLAVIETVAGQEPRLRGAFSAAKLLRLTENSRKQFGLSSRRGSAN